jgi:hypothetical protein
MGTGLFAAPVRLEDAMNLIARLAAIAGLLVSSAVQANCKPMLDALNKSEQQSRFAVYEVQNPEQALGGEPDVVIVGTVSYVRSGKEWERIEIGGLGATGHVYGRNSPAAS